MRTICFIFIFLLSCMLARGQSFVDNNNSWNVVEFAWSGKFTCIFHYDGDSLHNGLLYKKMYYWSDSTYTQKYFAGLLREDGEKVFFVHHFLGQDEGLLYDFSLDVGDTVDVISLFCPMNVNVRFICQAMDSIQLETGEYRKRWTLMGMEEEVWLEGIGSFYGPIYSGIRECIAGAHVVLYCFYNDEILLYSNAMSDDCYVSTVSIPEVERIIPVQIFPNPVQGGGSIKIKADFAIDKIEIFNSLGVLKQCTSGFEISDNLFETGRLHPGLYLIRISGRNGEFYTHKVLVQ